MTFLVLASIGMLIFSALPQNFLPFADAEGARETGRCFRWSGLNVDSTDFLESDWLRTAGSAAHQARRQEWRQTYAQPRSRTTYALVAVRTL